MPWIESHSELEGHPKTIDLAAQMGWDLDTTIGKLHRFWWWCQKYAEDGDLRRHNDSRLAVAVGLSVNDGKRFVEAMLRACWLEHEPYFRIHDWWKYQGPWLRAKYKRQQEVWEKIRDNYVTVTQPLRNRIPNLPNQTDKPVGGSRGVTVTGTVTEQADTTKSAQQRHGEIPICPYKYRDGTVCCNIREPRALYCRDHIEKLREMKAQRQDNRGGGLQKLVIKK